MVAQGDSFPLFDPEEVRGLLLGRYAVDPMPFDAVRMLFDPPRPAAPVRSDPRRTRAPVPSQPTAGPLSRRGPSAPAPTRRP